MRTGKIAIISLSIGVLIILLCSRSDTLYNPTGAQLARCYVRLCDTLIADPTASDTSSLAKRDTVRTGNPVAFIGIVTPADADLKSVRWNFGDGRDTSVAVALHRYRKGGVYCGVFTIEDRVGVTMSDTVVVCVNTPRDPT